MRAKLLILITGLSLLLSCKKTSIENKPPFDPCRGLQPWTANFTINYDSYCDLLIQSDTVYPDMPIVLVADFKDYSGDITYDWRKNLTGVIEGDSKFRFTSPSVSGVYPLKLTLTSYVRAWDSCYKPISITATKNLVVTSVFDNSMLGSYRFTDSLGVLYNFRTYYSPPDNRYLAVFKSTCSADSIIVFALFANKNLCLSGIPSNSCGLVDRLNIFKDKNGNLKIYHTYDGIKFHISNITKTS